MSKRVSNERIFRARSTAALGRLTAEFDREGVSGEFKPLSADSRRRWSVVRKKRGRPKKGQGIRVISVSVEKTLLARSDALAHRIGVTRAGLIERGLKAVLAAQGEA